MPKRNDALDELDKKVEAQVRRSLKLPDQRLVNAKAAERAANNVEKWIRKRDDAIRRAALEDHLPLRVIAQYAGMSHMSVSRVLHDVASPTTFGQRRSREKRQHVA
jgi:hypothetical protein